MRQDSDSRDGKVRILGAPALAILVVSGTLAACASSGYVSQSVATQSIVLEDSAGERLLVPPPSQRGGVSGAIELAAQVQIVDRAIAQAAPRLDPERLALALEFRDAAQSSLGEAIRDTEGMRGFAGVGIHRDYAQQVQGLASAAAAVMAAPTIHDMVVTRVRGPEGARLRYVSAKEYKKPEEQRAWLSYEYGQRLSGPRPYVFRALRPGSPACDEMIQVWGDPSVGTVDCP